MAVRIERKQGEWTVHYDANTPPDFFFDTGVWRAMSWADVSALKAFSESRAFGFRYTMTNFVELVSHLADAPNDRIKNPFAYFRACFKKIIDLCQDEPLPSPEEQFLRQLGLAHYISEGWSVTSIPIGEKVRAIADSPDLESLAEVVDITHYQRMRSTDGESIQNVMQQLSELLESGKVDSRRRIDYFLHAASVFLLFRPSNGFTIVDMLSSDEQQRFAGAFTRGGARMLYNHLLSRVRGVSKGGRKIDPNDMNDMLQLILLDNDNLIFVTGDKAFFEYEVDEGVLQRVLHWDDFRASLHETFADSDAGVGRRAGGGTGAGD